MDNSIRSSLIFEEIKLYDDSLERNRLEELSDLYAIIKTTELLEVAYSRDCITAEEYTDACNRIISQFKTTESALVSRKLIDNTDSFMKEFQIDGCARAYERLVVTGISHYIIYLNLFINLFNTSYLLNLCINTYILYIYLYIKEFQLQQFMVV